MELEYVALLLVAAAAAGWFDAVAGGGGLIQLPALLVAFPSAPVTGILATDKLSSVSGTYAAAVKFGGRVEIDRRIAVPAGAMAISLSALGACCAGLIPSNVLRALVLITLLGLGVFVALRREIGTQARPSLATQRRVTLAIVATGVILPFYNGVLGPGTGTMMVVVLSSLLGMDYVLGSATSKIINVGSNLGALLVFALQGQVFWKLGLAMAACNVAGGQLGAHTALRRGAGFIRVALLCVVAALLVKVAVS